MKPKMRTKEKYLSLVFISLWSKITSDTLSECHVEMRTCPFSYNNSFFTWVVAWRLLPLPPPPPPTVRPRWTVQVAGAGWRGRTKATSRMRRRIHARLLHFFSDFSVKCKKTVTHPIFLHRCITKKYRGFGKNRS